MAGSAAAGPPSRRRDPIAVLGVQGQCGPWAQGGRATVRPLTQRPYFNGPDGFGSGQPDGMVAGMADGSVRFLSKNIDPHVMEQLATVPAAIRSMWPRSSRSPSGRKRM